MDLCCCCCCCRRCWPRPLSDDAGERPLSIYQQPCASRLEKTTLSQAMHRMHVCMFVDMLTRKIGADPQHHRGSANLLLIPGHERARGRGVRGGKKALEKLITRNRPPEKGKKVRLCSPGRSSGSVFQSTSPPGTTTKQAIHMRRLFVLCLGSSLR